ncbi:MAG TPA: YfcE family phosphodiesterase [Pirellulales bacterium]|jgi:hypothetical protein|nr:YfcE family phosphodiesterase [Pirellulales bacterium]
MQIGVLGDTHGHVENCQNALRILRALQVEAILHCGDIGSVEIVPLFRGLAAHFVFGNVDDNEADLRAIIQTERHVCHERYGAIELAGRKIALLHSDDARLFRETIHNGQFDLVCYGHSHQAEQHRVKNTLVLNPGALYRAKKHTVALVDLITMKVTFIDV